LTYCKYFELYFKFLYILIIKKRSIALDKAIIKSHVNEKKEPSHSDENEINQKEQLETEFKTDMVERFKI
jgi:hypothetical protein